MRHQQHTSDIDGIDTRLGELAAQVNPALLQLPCVGPLVASQLLIACGDNPERLSSEQQFAALCGAAPIPASSGKHQRHPLSQGGDLTASSAIHSIVLMRMSAGDSRTVDYIARRTAEGKVRARDHPLPQTLRRARGFKLIRNPLSVSAAQADFANAAEHWPSRSPRVATALAALYQRVRRLEIGQRLISGRRGTPARSP
ncbi:transposase [Rhodococcus opacus]